MSVLTCISLAASGDLEGLEIWSLAGADLTKPGYDGQTAIQVVGIGARSRALREHLQADLLSSLLCCLTGAGRWQT